MKELNLKELSEKLSQENNIIIAAHISPDADAVGSSVGLAQGLEKLGKSVLVYLEDEIPSRLKGLTGATKVVHQLSEIDFNKFQTFVIIDTASKKRVGKEVDALIKAVKTTYNIDHHISNDCFAEFNYIESTSPASAVIVWKILKELKVSLNSSIANLLYAGTMDDTGRFCFSNTNVLALECAADLLAQGANPSFVSKQLYGSVPLKKLKLQAEAINSLQLLEGGKISLLSISKKTLDSFQGEADDTDGLVELIRSIEGVEVAVFQREIEDGWKFSLRSKKEEIDVNKIAGIFGGGGHKAAAGCKLIGSQEETAKTLIEQIKKVI